MNPVIDPIGKPANGNTGVVPPWLQKQVPEAPVLMDDENKSAIDQFIKNNPAAKSE